jgi:thiosulfate reductase cytochrome b subunit
LNALFFLVLIITGLNMQYSDPDNPFISFSISVKLHNICGIGLTASYLIFLIGNMITGNGKFYRIPVKGLFKRISLQARYYIRGFFKHEKAPFPVNGDRKFNPLQAISYTTAMYIGVPLLFITGLGLLIPEIVPGRIFGISGLLLSDLVHVITGFLMSVFMLVHIYMCTIRKKPAGSFRAIITGWIEVEEIK